MQPAAAGGSIRQTCVSATYSRHCLGKIQPQLLFSNPSLCTKLTTCSRWVSVVTTRQGAARHAREQNAAQPVYCLVAERGKHYAADLLTVQVMQLGRAAQHFHHAAGLEKAFEVQSALALLTATEYHRVRHITLAMCDRNLLLSILTSGAQALLSALAHIPSSQVTSIGYGSICQLPRWCHAHKHCCPDQPVHLPACTRSDQTPFISIGHT